MNDTSPSLQIALTADLHYGRRHTAGKLATLEMVAHLCERPPDLLILAGDIGAGDDFARCLDLFASLPCQKALVPGNHDIWVSAGDARGDSLRVYNEVLPRLSEERGFHYLDRGPLLLSEHGLAIAGSMNWYDYSWSIDDLPGAAPDWKERLYAKRFLRGRHNDGNFVIWKHTDPSFTSEIVQTLLRHIDDALNKVDRAIVVTHHPPIRELNYPAPEPYGLDELLWRAYSGNTMLESSLVERSERVAFTFCGHTHRAREGNRAGIRGFNIGGDYHFKRLLRLDWPRGDVEAIEFGEP
jgi:predicted phosphohydrolase